MKYIISLYKNEYMQNKGINFKRSLLFPIRIFAFLKKIVEGIESNNGETGNDYKVLKQALKVADPIVRLPI